MRHVDIESSTTQQLSLYSISPVNPMFIAASIDLRTICERLYPLVIQRSELENPPIFQKGKSSWAMASWQQTVDIWLIYGLYGALYMVYISQ